MSFKNIFNKELESKGNVNDINNIELDEDENILWQGKPDKDRMLSDCFDKKKLIIWESFVVLIFMSCMIFDHFVNIISLIITLLVMAYPIMKLKMDQKRILINYQYMFYILTNKRLIIQSRTDGIIDIPLKEINSINVKFNRKEDLVNQFGDIEIIRNFNENGTEYNQSIYLIDIINVNIIREKIENTVYENKEE